MYDIENINKSFKKFEYSINYSEKLMWNNFKNNMTFIHSSTNNSGKIIFLGFIINSKHSTRVTYNKLQ